MVNAEPLSTRLTTKSLFYFIPRYFSTVTAKNPKALDKWLSID